MFGLSGHQRIGITFTTGTTLSTFADVREWNHVAIEFATFASGLSVSSTNVYLQAAVNVTRGGKHGPLSAATATYRRMQDEGLYSAGALLADWEVPTFEGNRLVVCRPAARADYVKAELANATTHTFGCWVHVHN